MEKIIVFSRETIIPPIFSQTSYKIGSVVEFSGIVREEESRGKILHLNYEAYIEMATHQIHKILDELQKIYPCHFFYLIHRLGKVPVGEASLWIRITSKHRKEGFGLLTEFCDRLKKDVPIWKSTEPL